jgi:hypothetical protein
MTQTKRCKHCWHINGERYKTDRAVMVPRICCFCGTEAPARLGENVQPDTHGQHLPERPSQDKERKP